MDDCWVSEPDRGQSAAINRALRMGSGSHATWINSDDMLPRNAFFTQFTHHDFAPDMVHVAIVDQAEMYFSRTGDASSLWRACST
jgi:hypothetical protein